MEYEVRHRTTYRYLQSVSYSCHLAHLTPRETAAQRVAASKLKISQAPARRYGIEDYFGNKAEWFAIDSPHTVLEIVSDSRVSVQAAAPLKPADSLPWEQVRTQLGHTQDNATREATQFVFDSPLTAARSNIAVYAAVSFPRARPVLAGALDLMHRIHKDFQYDTTVTDATTPVDRVFQIRSGVCQDLAHVGIACLRSLGLAGRYVSGYLLTRPPPGQKRLLGADASHAWFSVWAPPFGWVDLDPTNDMRSGEGHVTVAWGRDYSDVAPINGIVTGGGDHLVEVGVDVVPVESGAMRAGA
ncbi:MAG: transglutaminase family protein [Rhizomicrobium sp.]